MWFILSLISGFLFASNRLLIRSILTKNNNPLTFGAIHELLAGLLLLPLGLYYFSLPKSPEIWFALIAGIFLIFLTDLFAFLALRNMEASLFQIVNQLRHIFVLIGAYFFFTEALTLSKLISIFLIIVGIVIALKSKTKFVITKETLYVAFSTLCISFGLLFMKMASVDVHPAFSASLGFLGAGILMYVVLLFKGASPKTFLPTRQRGKLFFAAAIFAVFELALFIALAMGEASKVTPVSQSSMIFTLIGGYLFLNERGELKQKIVGSILIAAGIVLLYVT